MSLESINGMPDVITTEEERDRMVNEIPRLELHRKLKALDLIADYDPRVRNRDAGNSDTILT